MKTLLSVLIIFFLYITPSSASSFFCDSPSFVKGCKDGAREGFEAFAKGKNMAAIQKQHLKSIDDFTVSRSCRDYGRVVGLYEAGYIFQEAGRKAARSLSGQDLEEGAFGFSLEVLGLIKKMAMQVYKASEDEANLALAYGLQLAHGECLKIDGGAQGIKNPFPAGFDGNGFLNRYRDNKQSQVVSSGNESTFGISRLRLFSSPSMKLPSKPWNFKNTFTSEDDFMALDLEFKFKSKLEHNESITFNLLFSKKGGGHVFSETLSTELPKGQQTYGVVLIKNLKTCFPQVDGNYTVSISDKEKKLKTVTFVFKTTATVTNKN